MPTLTIEEALEKVRTWQDRHWLDTDPLNVATVLAAAVESMQPVVAAAEVWSNSNGTGRDEWKLLNTLDTYRSGKGE